MNVIDELKDKTVDEIREYCRAKHNNAAVAMFNVGYDFNIASLVRGANAFGFKEVIHIQLQGRRWDKRGAVGTQHYTDINHFISSNDFWSYIKDRYTPVAIENNVNYHLSSLWDYKPINNACYILGAESQGLSADVLSKCRLCIYIPQFGSVRSLNVGITGGIIMNHHRQFSGINNTNG